MDGTQHPETPNGMDVHQASIVIVVLNIEGKTIFEAIIETKTEVVRDFMRGLRGELHVRGCSVQASRLPKMRVAIWLRAFPKHPLRLCPQNATPKSSASKVFAPSQAFLL